MATFVTTIKFTEKGIQAVQNSPKRAETFKKAAKKLGVKITDIYWTLGPFDGVIVCDAPNDETVTAAMLQLSAQGNVHTSTSRAFTASEMVKVIARVAKKK